MKAAPSLIVLMLPVVVTACRENAPASSSPPPPVAVRTQRVESGLIPLDAIVEGDGLKARVFTVERADGNAKAMRRDVTLKEITADGARPADTLPGGFELVTTGAEFLTDGTPVLITNNAAR